MDSKGDIFDEFDDSEDLVRSIEAGRKGPWDDAAKEFVDPKLAELQKQITQPKQADYAERRMRDLKKHGIGSGKKKKKGKSKSKGKQPHKPTIKKLSPAETHPDDQFREKPAAPKVKAAGRRVDPWAAELAKDATTATKANVDESPWGEPDNKSGADPFQAKTASALKRKVAHAASEGPATSIAAETLAAVEQRNARRQAQMVFARALMTSTLIFGAATAVQATMTSMRMELVYRGIGAATICALTWYLRRTKRTPAVVIGAIVFCVAFLPLNDLDKPQTLFSLILGLIVVLAGSFLLGEQPQGGASREASPTDADGADV